ncbi:MFS transporter, partial [Steroidobacter sp.]|uniref:MFS transporter n=1 Tax=Steroidobacter sp. TaxID=1978227 RepID=UPI001A475B7F
MVNIIDRHIVNILIEPIKADLGLGDAEAGFITGLAFALFYTVMGVPIAMLADRYNRTRLICLCSALWSLATAASGAASSYASMAAARMAVGVGEAGLTPTANSLIGDLFEPRNRGKALGIYISAVSVGTMLAGLLGGWLEHHVGWRMTFIILGIVGLGLTAIFRFAFREPARGHLDDAASQPEQRSYGLLETIGYLLRKRSCRYFFPAFALVGFVGAAINNWTPAFFMRSHGMNLMEMAASVGAIFGAGGALGMIGGGLLADHFSTRDVASYLKVPAIAVLVSLPLYFGVYLVPGSTPAMLLLVVPVTVAAIIMPPVLALLQRLVKNNMRAVAVAVFLVVVHLIGMG